MGRTTTVRLTRELADWLDEVWARTGLSRSRIIREELKKARVAAGSSRFMSIAGTVRGARALSSRKGFSRP
jgi:predicted DNA-binding protein